MRRMQFGRSSERITRQIEQLELQLEDLETGEAEDITKAAAEDRPEPMRPRAKPKRKPLPDHLPRQEIIRQPEADGACVCPDCGAGMAKLGEDVTEVVDYVPGRFQVPRHFRPKYACKACDAITQGPGTRNADAAWSRHAGNARPSAGVEVLRPSAALSASVPLAAARVRGSVLPGVAHRRIAVASRRDRRSDGLPEKAPKWRPALVGKRPDRTADLG